MRKRKSRRWATTGKKGAQKRMGAPRLYQNTIVDEIGTAQPCRVNSERWRAVVFHKAGKLAADITLSGDGGFLSRKGATPNRRISTRMNREQS